MGQGQKRGKRILSRLCAVSAEPNVANITLSIINVLIFSGKYIKVGKVCCIYCYRCSVWGTSCGGIM